MQNVNDNASRLGCTSYSLILSKFSVTIASFKLVILLNWLAVEDGIGIGILQVSWDPTQISLVALAGSGQSKNEQREPGSRSAASAQCCNRLLIGLHN